MKALFLLAISTCFSFYAFGEDSPVGAESVLKNNQLIFNIRNYSKDTSYDCVISYELRTYDEDHAYLRTAANLRTKVIFMEKDSSKKIKADFVLEENEKIAELAHAIKAPECTPAFRSRVVAIKNYYNLNVPANRSLGMLMNGGRNIILKADFKDITQFEISGSTEFTAKVGMDGMGVGMFSGYSLAPEQERYLGSNAHFYFLNERKKNFTIDQLTYYFNNTSKKIETYPSPKNKMCGNVLSSDYLLCFTEGKEEAVSFLNLTTNENLEFDQLAMDSFKDYSKDAANCEIQLPSTLKIEGDKVTLMNRCIKKIPAGKGVTFALARFDMGMEKETNDDGKPSLKFSSYNTVSEQDLRLTDIRKDYPWALFPFFYTNQNLKSISGKETLNDAVERLFRRKDLLPVEIINTGREDYFDIFLTDKEGTAHYGRIYWTDLK